METVETKKKLPLLVIAFVAAVALFLLLSLLFDPSLLNPKIYLEKFSAHWTRFAEKKDTVEGIEVIGSEWFRKTVAVQISNLQKAAPELLSEIANSVGVIQQGEFSKVYVRSNPRFIVLSDRDLDFSPQMGMAIIAHFSFHAKLQKEGKPAPKNSWEGQEEEKNCDIFARGILQSLPGHEHALKYFSQYGAKWVHGDLNHDGKEDLDDYLRRDQ